MELVTGLYEGRSPAMNDGWRILLEQEKTPFRTYDTGCPVMVAEGAVPEDLKSFLENGGVAVLTGIRPEMLPFPSDYIGAAVIERIDLTELGAGKPRIGSLITVYGGEGYGLICLHEKRVTKNGLLQDAYPAFVEQKIGKGTVYYSGIPFSELIVAQGDILREPDIDFPDFDERVTAVDKAPLLMGMRAMLIRAFKKAGLPYVRLRYYPGTNKSVFMFRSDLDGFYGENIGIFSKAAKDAGVRVTFYFNHDLCEGEIERIRDIDPCHDIACHAIFHNLYTDEESNYMNVHSAVEWMKSLGLEFKHSYVAPRGMWNFALNRALEREGFDYSSDFGYDIYGLPFYPYYNGKRSTVKQIPTDPFNTERATIKAAEEGRPKPDAEYICNHFLASARKQYELGMPIMLYSHPQYFGPLAPKVFPSLMKEINSWDGLWHATIQEMNDWWDLRDSAEYRAYSENGEISTEGTLPDGVRIETL